MNKKRSLHAWMERLGAEIESIKKHRKRFASLLSDREEQIIQRALDIRIREISTLRHIPQEEGLALAM